MNTFGSRLRVTLFGESHGAAVGVVIDGVPPGIALSESDFLPDMARRRPAGRGATARREEDRLHILSGVYGGFTTGAPLTVTIDNEDVRPQDYARFAEHPRPSHADYTARVKYGGFNDPRGGGRFSGRLTAGLVAAGTVAKRVLGEKIAFSSGVVSIGGCGDESAWEGMVAQALAEGDSLGGVVECRVEGVPAGWGEPFFDSVESVASHLLFSIPGVKGVEFGSGFAGAATRGSQNNDPIISADGATATNNSGGIDGGIANGNALIVRVAVKPTASVAAPQQTWNFGSGRMETLSIGGRHDACIALRMPVIAEAAMAIALAQFR